MKIQSVLLDENKTSDFDNKIKLLKQREKLSQELIEKVEDLLIK